MADKFVQLKDSDGNNLYPVVADFPLSVSNGGTGATTAANALKNLVASSIDYSGSVSGSLSTLFQNTRTYTAHGSGLVFFSVSIKVGENTWGTARVTISKNNSVVAVGSDTITANYNGGRDTNGHTSALVKVADGDTVSVSVIATRYTSGNTYTLYYNVIALGCSLTTS